MVLLGLVALSRADETFEALQKNCDSGTAQACYQLALRYREGRDVAKDTDRSSALLLKACDGGFSQACFTACLVDVNARHTCPYTGPEPWQSVRALVGARDTEQRRQMLAASRDLNFLWWMIRNDPYVEIASLPDWQALHDAAQARLLKIARSDPDPIKRAAVIPDMYTVIPTEVLKEIARSDPDPRVRKAAKERLVSDLSPLWNERDAAEVLRMVKSRDVETRRAAVGKLADQKLLGELAEKDPDAGVRADAVSRLADYVDASQAVLVRIAEKDKDEQVRFAASALVKDQKALERLVRTSRTDEVRRYALERLTDPSVLAWVAEHDGNEEVRQEATSRTTDQPTLARIAKSDRSGYVRGVAASLLKDQRLLAEIVKKDPDPWGRLGAIAAITDRALLAQVAQGDADATVREVASKRLKALSPK